METSTAKFYDTLFERDLVMMLFPHQLYIQHFAIGMIAPIFLKKFNRKIVVMVHQKACQTQLRLYQKYEKHKGKSWEVFALSKGISIESWETKTVP